MPGVVVYLTFTLMYGGIITHSFITCKLHLKQSGKVPQPVLFLLATLFSDLDNSDYPLIAMNVTIFVTLTLFRNTHDFLLE